jgi:cyclopropane fatty-acyl-phospholipid synthase-like methyltransferase
MNDLMKKHWNEIYTYLEEDEVGWYEEIPESSIKLLSKCNINKEDPILDIGSGASLFIDYLIEKGFKNIIAVDISEDALEKSKKRIQKNLMGKEEIPVRWIVDDITAPVYIQDLKDIAVWHDRAVLHFLIEENDQKKYLDLLNKVIKKNGYVIIATFSLKGVKKCAGLDVKNYDHNMLTIFLGSEYKLIEYFDHVQHTPSGELRPYIYTLFKKIGES